ncbi:MAG: tetratricopeptide repeat protein, partial [Eubacterium sp.]|nr:tetratricopeptide repeat protein [Eubacterium sp.]
FYDDAINLLNMDKRNYPMVDYYKAYYSYKANKEYNLYLEKAFNDNPYCCFPNRIEDITVLEFAMRNNKKDFKAPYYLGNLYYDKERHDEAIECFERSIALGCDFATPYRNLSLLYYNVKNNSLKALELLETAYAMDKTDARVLYELDLLKKRIGVSPNERLEFLEQHFDIVSTRDDLYLEYITLLNLTKSYDKALKLIMAHKFHPWEGGEGKVPEQYLFSNIALALEKQDIKYLLSTFEYPHNLGEGKLYGAQENRQNYYLGCAYEKQGKFDLAKDCFTKASSGISEPASAMYYNDQPPETIFYQGLALLKLGDIESANNRFNKLISYADHHIDDNVTIDYFAVSLPDLLVFEEDLNKKNKLHCLFMKALGLYGLNKKEKSKALFEQALAENCNTFQIVTHYQLLFRQ